MNRIFVFVLAVFTTAAALAGEPKRLLLIGQGPDGHPPASHEFMAGVKIMEALLKNQPGLQVTTVNATNPWPAGPELIQKADGVVLYVCEGAKWANAEPRRLDALAQLAKRKGGIVALHWGIGCKDDIFIDTAKQLWGGCHGGSDRKYKVLETDLKPVAEEPIMRGIDALKVNDEFYYNLKFATAGKLRPFMRATIEKEDYTVAWGWERPDGGRSAGFSGLHFHENWKQPTYRRLVLQSILWTNGLDIPEKRAAVEIADELYKLK